MRIGTKSLLFGVHQVCWHPLLVAMAWWTLYGFPWDPRLWVAFLVHDWGYWGKPNMDGTEGEQHVWLGAQIMGTLFDATRVFAKWHTHLIGGTCNLIWGVEPEGITWYQFGFYHSRHKAKAYRVPTSRLCVADKLSFAMEPAWLYLFRARLTGELAEYLERAKERAGRNEAITEEERRLVTSGEPRKWHAGVALYLRRWVARHKDGAEDHWTAQPASETKAPQRSDDSKRRCGRRPGDRERF